MKITKIKLNNYKQYCDEQVIEVPKEGKIVIIQGENGAGKTNLLNGLTWALYNSKMDRERLFNDNTLYSLDNDESVDMFIEIHFEHADKDHILIRKLFATRQSSESFTYDEEYKLEVMESGELESITDEIKIENYINSILNFAVKDYFFFDGAKIEQFTKDDHNEDVKKAIKNLLKIETIKRARGHVQAITNEVRRSIKDENYGEELQSLNEEISELEEGLASNNEKIKALKKDISRLDKDISKTLNEIEHIEENSNYKSKKTDFENKLKDLRKDLANTREQLRKDLSNSFLIFADKLVNDAINIIQDKVSSDEITISNSALKAIIKNSIDEKECYICERELTKNDKDRLLAKVPEITMKKSNRNDLMNLASEFKIFLKDRKDMFEDIVKNRNDIINAEEKETKLEELVDEYDEKINEELPDAKEYKAMIQTLQKDKQEKISNKKDLENDNERIRKELEEKEEEHTEISKLSEQCEKERKTLDICYKIRDELNGIFNKYEETEIKKINKETKRIFDLIIRKEDVFKKIFIDDKYKLNVNRNYQKNVLTELSYGERQILSLSLILGLAKVSGDVAPFVMDTPMGNLDPIHRRKLIENIPMFVNQLFLLVTGSEFTDGLYQRCHDNIAVQYNLVTKDDGMTVVEKEEV